MTALTQAAAWIALLGFAAMTLFQILLAAGAPLGDMAWGGKYTRLPAGLRVASLVSAAIFVFGAICVMERAGIMEVLGLPDLVGIVVWVLAGMFALSSLGNLASPSIRERRIMTPLAMLLSAACVVVALGL